ncbi:MAG TPA: radical SAM protein [Planctomycetota bacterium]|nr:radical SAM protein [Planctomycetota bacterium]
MRVLLVYTVSETLPAPSKPIAEFIEISFSVAYLGAALKRAGHESTLVVLRHGRFKKELAAAIEKARPDLVCSTAVATEYPFIEKIARWTRERCPDAYHVVGGTHSILCPAEVCEGPWDAVCIGEGEAAIVELADTLERGETPRGIDGWWIRHGTEVEKNPTRHFEENLDALAIPDRGIWREWIEDPRKHTILIARGCPFPCTYCSNHALSQTAEGKFLRFRAVECVIAELKQVCEEFPETTYCYFEVETITSNRKWAFEFAEHLKAFNAQRETPLEFATNFRVHPKKRFLDFFEALRGAGFSYLRIGIESGSDRIRKEVLKRYESNQDLLNTFEDAQSAGLQVYAYNLIGIPGETPEDFMETVKINQSSVIARSYIGIFYPYPGTELATVCKERGIVVPPLEDGAERFRARLGLPEFPDRQVERLFRDFSFLVAGEQVGFLKRADAFLWQTIRGYPALERFARRWSGTGVLSGIRRGAGHLRGLFPGASSTETGA